MIFDLVRDFASVLDRLLSTAVPPGEPERSGGGGSSFPLSTQSRRMGATGSVKPSRDPLLVEVTPLSNSINQARIRWTNILRIR